LNASQTPLQLALQTTAGTILGLGLAAYYILPAAFERSYVQIAMAIIPNMRIQDNFLFHHTGDIPHDQVLHTASLVAVILIAATVIALITLRLIQKATNPGTPSSARLLRLSRGPCQLAGGVVRWASRVSATAPAHLTQRPVLYALAILTIAITLLLTPITAFIWNHVPELPYLQFPWRLLAILAAVLSLTIALALPPIKFNPTVTAAIALAIATVLTYPAYTVFHQACDSEDTVQARLALVHSNQGTDPTDEYTPTTADNDSLAHNNPAWWLSPDPNAKAPINAQPGPAPTHLTLNSPAPEDLILNLRDYPAWRIALNGTPVTARIQRDDGLITFPVPAGPATIDTTYTQTRDQTLGDIFTAISLVLLLLTLLRRKYTATQP
jgi:hypothetical protein